MRLSGFGILLWALACFGRLASPLPGLEPGALDPLAGAVICTHDGGFASRESSGDAKDDHAHCLLACAQLGQLIDPSPFSAAKPHRIAVQTPWLTLASSAMVRAASTGFLARAPPILS